MNCYMVYATGDCYFTIDGFNGFLSDIDPYKAVDKMGKLREYLKNHLDLSEITKCQEK